MGSNNFNPFQPGEKVPLKLTPAERKMVLENLMSLDQDCEQIIQDTPISNPVMMTLDNLDDFGGYIAAEAMGQSVQRSAGRGCVSQRNRVGRSGQQYPLSESKRVSGCKLEEFGSCCFRSHQNVEEKKMLSKRFTLFAAMLYLSAASTTYAADSHPTGSWILVEINGEKIDGRAPTIRFTEKGIDGSTGVNRFFGKYAEEGENLFGEGIGMTRRAGAPEAMKLERDYVNALQAVTKHRIEKEQLILGKGDNIKLVFKAEPEE